jgi:predicted DNA-binding transcriptional regulator AlpA
MPSIGTTASPASGTDILLTDHQVAAITGRSRKTLQKDRVYGGGLPFIQFGRSVRYRSSDVAVWLASQRSFTSTSEYGVTKSVERNRGTRLAADQADNKTGVTDQIDSARPHPADTR